MGICPFYWRVFSLEVLLRVEILCLKNEGRFGWFLLVMMVNGCHAYRSHSFGLLTPWFLWRACLIIEEDNVRSRQLNLFLLLLLLL